MGNLINGDSQFQHTATRRRLPPKIALKQFAFSVSTHSRTKAAANNHKQLLQLKKVSTHSRTKAAAVSFVLSSILILFQHTAARRRLPKTDLDAKIDEVSTHSRTKAAANKILF